MLASNNSSAANIVQMCSFDANKSTKGASKLRRDLINSEISNLRDLLPLPSSTRQRLSQLQLMALVCVYVRKSNYFQQVFRKQDLNQDLGPPVPNFGFSKALSGFIMMMTQNGKLLYISDNAAEYLGHSMEDLLIHGDSVYDIIEKQDHQAIQSELMRSPNVPSPHHHHHHHLGFMSGSRTDSRIFLCRMNVSRNARRQMRFGDQKVVLVEGHYVSFLPLCSRNEPVFVATCTPVAMPETRECVVHGSTNVFSSIHSMDMNFAHLDSNGEIHLGYTKQELQGTSWYQLLHWESMKEAQTKHRLITTSEQERSCIMLVRLQKRDGKWVWVHVVLQVKEGSSGSDSSQQPIIVSTNQILTDREAAVMRANSWLYHYYSVHSKIQYGLTSTPTGSVTAPYDPHATSRIASAYYPPLLPYHHHHHHPHHHHHSSHPDSTPYLSPHPAAAPPPPPVSFSNINGTSSSGHYGSYHHHHGYQHHGGSHHHTHHHHHHHQQQDQNQLQSTNTHSKASEQVDSWKLDRKRRSVASSSEEDVNCATSVGGSSTKWRRIVGSSSTSVSSSTCGTATTGLLSVSVPQPVPIMGTATANVGVGATHHSADSRTYLRSLQQRKLGESESSESDNEHHTSVTPTNTQDVASWISLSASVNDSYAGPVGGSPGGYSHDTLLAPHDSAVGGGNTVDGSTTGSKMTSSANAVATDPLLLEKTQTFARLVQQYGPRLDDQILKTLERSVFGDVLMQELHMLGQYLRQGPNFPNPIKAIDDGQKSPSCESHDSDYQSQTMSPQSSTSSPSSSSSSTSSSSSSSIVHPATTTASNPTTTSLPHHYHHHYLHYQHHPNHVTYEHSSAPPSGYSFDRNYQYHATPPSGL